MPKPLCDRLNATERDLRIALLSLMINSAHAAVGTARSSYTLVSVLLTTTAALAAFAIYEALFAIQLWRAIPYADHWHGVIVYRAWKSGGLSPFQFAVQYLLGPHAEHRVLPTQFAILLDFSLFRGQAIFVQVLLLLAHAALGGALGLLATRGQNFALRLCAAVTGTTLLLSPQQIENLTLPFHLGWAMSGLLAVGAFFWTACLVDTGRWRWTLLLSASVATTLCVYTLANGLVIAAIIIVMAAILRVGGVARVILMAVSVAAIGGFFIGYQLPPPHASYHASLSSFDGIGRFVIFVLADLGNIAGAFGIACSALLGAFGVIAWAATALSMWRQHQKGSIDPAVWTLLAIATASIGTAAMTAFGRAGFEPISALTPRYATWSLLFWLGLVGIAWRSLSLNNCVAARAVLVSFIVALIGSSFVSGQPWLTYAKDLAGRLDNQTQRLRNGEDIVPLGATSDLIAFLRQERLSIFASHSADH